MNAKSRRDYLGMLLAAVVGNATESLAQGAPRSPPGSKVWRIAVVPQLTPVETQKHWGPIVKILTEAGFPSEMVVHPSIARFEKEFLTGLADLVYLNPYHMVMARRTHGYIPLIRDSRPLEGVLVVKADGPVRDISQLKDHQISFPAPNAFAASLFIRAVLDREYKLPFESHYAGTHRNAIRQVLAGNSAAAGIVKTTLENEPADVKSALRVLYNTPGRAAHPLAVHPRVPPAMRKIIVDSFLALSMDPNTKNMLTAVQLPNPVPADYARDYAPLERLKLERYVIND